MTPNSSLDLRAQQGAFAGTIKQGAGSKSLSPVTSSKLAAAALQTQLAELQQKLQVRAA